MITGSAVSARKVWVPFKYIQDVNVFLFRFTSRDVRDLHNATIEVHDSLLSPEFTFLTWFPQKTLTFSGFTLLNTVIFLKLRCDWRLDSWVKRNKAWKNNPFGYNNRNMYAYYFLGGRKNLKYKQHGNFTLLKICQKCAKVQFSVKDLRRSFGPPFPKTVTVTKWTPRKHQCKQQHRTGKGVYVTQTSVDRSQLHTYPELFTTQPGKHKLLLAGSWWGNRLRDQKKSCIEVLALLHSHILHVYSRLSSKDTGLFLPVVGHFLMSNLWCMRAVWSWQTGHTEENLSLFSFNTVGKNLF